MARTSTDIRTVVLELGRVTPEELTRLDGRACARCGNTKGLRPGGHAQTKSRGGLLGWAVKVCPDCPQQM